MLHAPLAIYLNQTTRQSVSVQCKGAMSRLAKNTQYNILGMYF